jgi:hypothetical protein
MFLALLVSAACSSSNGGGGQEQADAGKDSGSKDGGGDAGKAKDSGSPSDGTAPADSSADSTVVGNDASMDAPAVESSTVQDTSAPGHAIKTVFLVMMENHNWSLVTGDSSATYINGTLVPKYASANNYKNPPGIHPSLPNYLWLEAGTNFNISADADPGASNTQSTTSHLVTQLTTAGVSWKAYVEGISGTDCPLSTSGLFAPKHTPMLYFDDVTSNGSTTSANCISHIVPYTNLATDLTANTVARYNFITPNLCDDMHNSSGCASSDAVANGDAWLSTNVPAILASQAYLNGGVLFILWDEGTGSSSDGPVGLIVMSPVAKAGGYTNTIAYTHSSMLKSVEEIFGVPLLADAASATTTDLADFFTSFP